jgi:hypothetical protein
MKDGIKHIAIQPKTVTVVVCLLNEKNKAIVVSRIIRKELGK